MELPDGLATAAAGALLAAIGYVAKTVIELFKEKHQEQRQRRAALVQLGSLLNASHVAFKIQNQLARRLVGLIETNHPEIPTAGGLESTMSRAYSVLSDEERELHAVVRGYAGAMRTANQQLVDWVRNDTFFKTRFDRGNSEEKFARQLAVMEAHLLLWFAKYDAWIPDQPHHALVYLNDEKAHGLEFPYTIDETVKALLAKT